MCGRIDELQDKSELLKDPWVNVCMLQIARKVYQIWLELKSMRSPKATVKLCLQCSVSKEAAEKDVSLL